MHIYVADENDCYGITGSLPQNEQQAGSRSVCSPASLLSGLGLDIFATTSRIAFLDGFRFRCGDSRLEGCEAQGLGEGFQDLLPHGRSSFATI
jgi:hypothetical protein